MSHVLDLQTVEVPQLGRDTGGELEHNHCPPSVKSILCCPFSVMSLITC